jgi:hypothetical protein
MLGAKECVFTENMLKWPCLREQKTPGIHWRLLSRCNQSDGAAAGL